MGGSFGFYGEWSVFFRRKLFELNESQIGLSKCTVRLALDFPRSTSIDYGRAKFETVLKIQFVLGFVRYLVLLPCKAPILSFVSETHKSGLERNVSFSLCLIVQSILLTNYVTSLALSSHLLPEFRYQCSVRHSSRTSPSCCVYRNSSFPI